MAALLQLVKLFSRKRAEEFLSLQYKINEEAERKRFVRRADFETEASEPAVMSAIVITKSNRNERGPDELTNGDWWTNEYQNWDKASFKKKLRVSRDTFKFFLGEIKDSKEGAHSHETSTYSTSYPVGRLLHGCTLLTTSFPGSLIFSKFLVI